MDSSRVTNVGITILPTDVVIDESFERGSRDSYGGGISSTNPPNNSSSTSSSTSGFYDVLLGNFANHLKKQFEQRGQTPDGTILQITEQSMSVAATQLVSIIIEQRKGRFLLQQRQQQQHNQQGVGSSLCIRVMSKDEAVRKVAVDLFSIIRKDSNSVIGIESSLFASAQPIGRYPQSLPPKQNQASQQSKQPMYASADSTIATGLTFNNTSNNNNFGIAGSINKETSEPPSAAELVGDSFCDIIAPQTAPSVSMLPPTSNDIISRSMYQPTSHSISSYQLSSSHAGTQQQHLLQQQQQQQQQIIQQKQLQQQQQQRHQSFGGMPSGVSSFPQQHTLSSHNQHFRGAEKTLLELQLQQKYCNGQQRTQQFDNRNPNILDMNHLYQQSQPYHAQVHPKHHGQQQQNVQNQDAGIPFTDTFLSRESNQHSRPDFSLIQSGNNSIENVSMNFFGRSNLAPHRDDPDLNTLYSNRSNVESTKKSRRIKKNKPIKSASSTIQSFDHDKVLNEEEQNELKKKIRRERDKARRDRLALMKRETIPLENRPVNDKKAPATMDGKKSTRKLNLSYAVRLVLAVLRRSAAGKSPVVAAKALDHPLVASRVKGNKVKEVVTVEPSLETENTATTDIPNEASKQQQQQQQELSIVRVMESAKERNMRLLLRHRFLAAARNKVSLFDFSKKLLEMWNCLDAIRLAGSMQMKSASKLNKKRQKDCQSINSKKRKIDDNQSSPTTSSDRTPVGNNIHVIDGNTDRNRGTQNVGSRLSGSITNEVTDAQDEYDNQTSIAVEGIWTYEERFAFLKEWERRGLSNWDTMAEVLFTRNRTQVSGFGRYILRKFNIARSDPPNDEIRELLLKPNAASCAVLTTEQKTALLTGQRNVVDPQENSILISPLVTTKTSNNIFMTATSSANATRITSSEVGSPQTWQLDHLYSDATTSELMAQLPPDDRIGAQLNVADLSHDEFALVDFGHGPTDNHYPTL